MPLQQLKVTDFRCFSTAVFDADPKYNLIYGVNASGKTSLLEAISYLGRGKSFRGAPTQNLIRHGGSDFLLLGRVVSGGRCSTVGVRNGRQGLEVRIDSDTKKGAAALADALPLLVIDPDVHDLIAGGPEQRRRYLDWLAFHVEHGYLDIWRRFRRALRQRNAALRDNADDSVLAGWDREFVEAADRVHETRTRMVKLSDPVFQASTEALLGTAAQLDYRPGWKSDRSLSEAVAASTGRDREAGTTHSGPHRADLRLALEERQAKKVVSRGQQKLLACSLVLAAAELVQRHLEQPLLLLLDDPAAELDPASLQKLMNAVVGLGCQVVATSLSGETSLFPEPPALFHVEQGELRKVSPK